MFKKAISYDLLLCFVILALVGCSVIPVAPDNSAKINLSDLLINAADLPSGWSYGGFTGPTADLRYMDNGTDSISTLFYTDSDPNQNHPFAEFVYRASGFLANSRAQNNYDYLVKEMMQAGSAPPAWKFQSQFADRTSIDCGTPPDDSYMGCHWIAKYRSVVIFVVAWLIPDRMTLTELNIIISKIDAKAGKVILGK